VQSIAESNHEDFMKTNQQAQDATLLVKFELRAKLDVEATEKAGRPIYNDHEYIDIRAPGSPDNVNRPATLRDKERFPRHYSAFKNRTDGDELMDGTPLSEWPLVNRSQVEEFAFANIKTVEQLAATSDVNGQQFMNFPSMKQKAADWLEVANKGIKAADLQKELASRDEDIAELKEQVAALIETSKPRKKKAAKKE